ncbi:MAG TPA: DUF5522 domain-containing protein [Acidisarcina sp.]
MSDPRPPRTSTRTDAATGKILREGEDYYYDGPYLVFTAQYHLNRGECCGSGCRHCPYGNSPADNK